MSEGGESEREKALANIHGLMKGKSIEASLAAFLSRRKITSPDSKAATGQAAIPRIPAVRKSSNRKRVRPRQDTDLLDESQVAGMLAVSLSTIRRWRLLGRGPTFRKIGSSVRYKPEDVASYIESRPRGGERQ